MQSRKRPRSSSFSKAQDVAASTIQKFVRRRKSTFSNKFYEKGSSVPEAKQVMITLNAGVGDFTAPYSFLVNQISQGASFAQRIGSKVRMISLQVKAMISNEYNDLISAGKSIGCRFAIVHDKSSAQAVPNPSQIWAPVGTPAVDVYALRNMEFIDRYNVLYDEVFNLDNVEASCKIIDKYIKISLESRFSGSGGTVASLATGGIFVYIWNEVPSGLGLNPLAQGYIRVKFTDE